MPENCRISKAYLLSQLDGSLRLSTQRRPICRGQVALSFELPSKYYRFPTNRNDKENDALTTRNYFLFCETEKLRWWDKPYE